MQMVDFWDVAPCSLVDINRRFGGAWYCFLLQGDDRTTRGNIAGCRNGLQVLTLKDVML
jgi:hypothetical protein